MFEQDIFISYGWSGNTRHEGVVSRVRELRNQLRIALRDPLGHDPEIFLDTEDTRAGELTAALERAIDRSRLLLFVVSPGSCQSVWCQWEILRFLDRAHCIATRNDVLLPEDRLFGVVLEPVPTEQLPAPLQSLVFRPFDLTRPIEGRDGTRPVEWDSLGETPVAKAEFDRLVFDLQSHLQTLKEHEQNPVKPTGVTAFLGTAPLPAQEKELLTPLRRDLLLRGHTVLRGSAAAKETEDEYRVRLGPLLGQCQLSVHLLSEPVTPPGWSQSVGAWQLRRAAEQQTKLSRFIWEDPDRHADPRELAELLSQGDQRLDRRQTWSDLSQAVLNRANELAHVRAAQSVQGRKSVVIAYCDEDLPYASAIMRRLQQAYSFQVQLALPPKDAAGPRNRINRELFKQADALLVYYSRHDEWLYLTCINARKVIAKPSSPAKPAGLVLHPPPPPKDNCDQIGFTSLPRTGPDDFAAIDAWAANVAAGAAP
jgi:hypothetical protein